MSANRRHGGGRAAPVGAGSRQAVRRARRRQRHRLRHPLRRDSRADRPQRFRKSTVMKLIMGIERPDAGSVRVDDVDMAGWPPYRIARAGVGIVFQHSRPLHRQTVLENVKLAMLPDSLLRLAAEPGVDERARAIAESVGLGAVLHRHPSTLPFADLRRMEMAKAIARDPKVVLIDEPFAGLTAGEIGTFADLIRQLRDEGRAVLLVDHNVKSVAALVDRVLAMYLGEKVAEGTADEVMRDETVRRVYLGGAIEAIDRARERRRGAAGAARRRRRQRVLRQGAGARQRVDRTCAKASSSRSSASTAPARRRCSTRSPAWCRTRGDDPVRRARAARHDTRRDRARRRRAMPGDARAVRRHDRAREPRPRRPAPARKRTARRSSRGCSSCSRSSRRAERRSRARSPAASSRCSRSRAR